jgi:hypothetical protein
MNVVGANIFWSLARHLRYLAIVIDSPIAIDEECDEDRSTAGMHHDCE